MPMRKFQHMPHPRLATQPSPLQSDTSGRPRLFDSPDAGRRFHPYLPGTRDVRPAPSHSSERGPPHAAQTEASSRRTLRERWLRQGIAGDEQKKRRERARGEWTEQRRVGAANYSMLRGVSGMCNEYGVKVCTVGGVRGILWGLESGGEECVSLRV